MKKSPLIIVVLCIILLAACGNLKDMGKVWDVCNSASGSPSGNSVSGKVYEIDNLYEGQPFFELQSRNEGAMRYGFKYLYQEYENFTQELSEASTVLCVEATTALVSQCSYNTGGKDFTLMRYHVDANLKLITWPSAEVIAQTTLEGSSFGKCPSEVWHDSNETSYDVYDGLDLNGWLDQYVTITE
jgi:hypothetical protein